MLDAPFLELAYFVGEFNMARAIDAIKSKFHLCGSSPKFAAPSAIGIAGDREELVVRGGVVEFRSEGGAFSGSESRQQPGVRALGEIVFKKFVSIANLVHPLYGAILVEYSLEDPGELRKDSRSLAFRNFFLAKPALDEHAWRLLWGLFDGRVYRFAAPNGVYISTTPYLNPDGKGLPPTDAQELSAKVGSLLATSLRDKW